MKKTPSHFMLVSQVDQIILIYEATVLFLLDTSKSLNTLAMCTQVI